jgi:hypothetical protein
MTGAGLAFLIVRLASATSRPAAESVLFTPPCPDEVVGMKSRERTGASRVAESLVPAALRNR